MNGVTQITSEQDIMLITFTGADTNKISLAMALKAFADNGIVVDMISQSTPRADVIDFSFTVAYRHFNEALKTIASSKAKAPLLSIGFSKINLFGEEMVTTCGVAATALAALAENKIELFMITTSDLDISLLVRAEQEDAALEALKNIFLISKEPSA